MKLDSDDGQCGVSGVARTGSVGVAIMVLAVATAVVAAMGTALAADKATLSTQSVATRRPETQATNTKRSATQSMTLDEVRIAGEIAMPQVLFVTSYEQLRFASVSHRDEVSSVSDVLAALPWPGVPWALGSERLRCLPTPPACMWSGPGRPGNTT